MHVKQMLPREMAEQVEAQPETFVPLVISPLESSAPGYCTNCNGHGIVMAYKITGRYSPTYAGGKAKWLEHGPQGPGWYPGEMLMEPCPVCRDGAKREWLERNSGLTAEERSTYSLSNFVTTGAMKDKADAKTIAGRLLGMNEGAAGFVTYYGSFGVGKSHLLKGLVAGFVGIDVPARYVTLADLLAEVRDCFGEQFGGQQAEEMIASYRQTRVLAIDEIDKVNLTAWAREVTFRLLDARYEERGHLLTVLATNVDPAGMDDPGAKLDLGYLGSRMEGGIVVRVGGGDVRMVQGAKAKRELVGGAR